MKQQYEKNGREVKQNVFFCRIYNHTVGIWIVWMTDDEFFKNFKSSGRGLTELSSRNLSTYTKERHEKLQSS
jgi:hypothetical protein